METATPVRKLIALERVESNQIFAIGYDEPTETLAIQFKNHRSPDGSGGAVYHYANFPVTEFHKFRHADSKGKFFGEYIKPATLQYPYVRVDTVKVDG